MLRNSAPVPKFFQLGWGKSLLPAVMAMQRANVSIAARGLAPRGAGAGMSRAVQEEVAARWARGLPRGAWRRCSGLRGRVAGGGDRAANARRQQRNCTCVVWTRAFCPAGIWRNDHASRLSGQKPRSSSMPARCSTKCSQARRGNDGGRGLCPS